MKLASIFVAALMTFALGAQAQTAGSWRIQAGFTKVTPDVTSGDLSAPAPGGTKSDVGADTQPTAQVTYMLSDHLALALPLGLGFDHKIYGAGALDGVGQIGSVHVLPATVFLQYRFGEATAQSRPYLMAGASYVKFSDAQGSAVLNALNPLNPVGGVTTLDVQSKFAMSIGLGLTVQLNKAWFADLAYSKMFLKNLTTLSTGQTQTMTLNPAAFSLSVGRNF